MSRISAYCKRFLRLKASSHKKAPKALELFSFCTRRNRNADSYFLKNPNSYKIELLIGHQIIHVKTIIAILICLGVVFCSLAQKIKSEEIPSNVKSAFEKKYPNVKKVKWEKEGDAYEASFDLKKEEVSALFDAAGNMKEVETEIETQAMPTAVKNLLTKDYPNYKITEAAKIVSQNTITYEAEVKRGKESFDLIFSEDGKLLKKIEQKSKKD